MAKLTDRARNDINVSNPVKHQHNNNSNAYAKYCESSSIHTQNIEQKRNNDVIKGS